MNITSKRKKESSLRTERRDTLCTFGDQYPLHKAANLLLLKRIKYF